jgi:hypothetical protein
MQRPPPNPFLAALLTTAPSHDKRLRELYAGLNPAWGWIVLAPTADSIAKYDSTVFTDEVVGITSPYGALTDSSESYYQSSRHRREIIERQEQEPTLRYA